MIFNKKQKQGFFFNKKHDKSWEIRLDKNNFSYIYTIKRNTMIEQILLQQTEREMEKRYEQHLQQEMEAEQLEECKRITLRRNAEKQKEMEQQRRLNNFFDALTNFMED